MWRATLAGLLDARNIAWDDLEQRRHLSRIERVRKKEISLTAEDRIDFEGTDCIRNDAEVRTALVEDVIVRQPHEYQDFIEGKIQPKSGPIRDLLWHHQLPIDLLVANPSAGMQPAMEIIDRPEPLSALRDYQAELVEDIVSSLGSGGSSRLLSLPTGAGKTRVALEGVLQWLEACPNSKTVWWFAGTKELCGQAAESSKEVWVDLALRRSGQGDGMDLRLLRHWDANKKLPPQQHSLDTHNLIIGTYQQANSRLADPKSPASDWMSESSVLVFDEAHLRSDDQEGVIASATNARHRIGLTATPDKADPVSAADIQERFPKPLIPIATLNLSHLDGLTDRLTERGYLSELDVQRESVWKILQAEQIEDLYSDSRREFNHGHMRALRDIVVRLLKDDGKKSVLVFVTAIEEAKIVSLAVNRRLRELGRSELSRAVHSGLGRADRNELLSDFKGGRLSCLFNVEILTAGFDAPCIDCVVIAKNVTEPSHRLQMLGRGLRWPESGGTARCLVIDLDLEP